MKYLFELYLKNIIRVYTNVFSEFVGFYFKNTKQTII